MYIQRSFSWGLGLIRLPAAGEVLSDWLDRVMCFFTVAQAIFTIVFVLLKMPHIVYEPDTLIGTSQRDKLPWYFS